MLYDNGTKTSLFQSSVKTVTSFIPSGDGRDGFFMSPVGHCKSLFQSSVKILHHRHAYRDDGREGFFL